MGHRIGHRVQIGLGAKAGEASNPAHLNSEPGS